MQSLKGLEKTMLAPSHQMSAALTINTDSDPVIPNRVAASSNTATRTLRKSDEFLRQPPIQIHHQEGQNFMACCQGKSSLMNVARNLTAMFGEASKVNSTSHWLDRLERLDTMQEMGARNRKCTEV
jgi:hypothetical protein